MAEDCVEEDPMAGKFDQIMDKLADIYYPVGHYIFTTSNTNPNNLGIKGTWELKSKTLQMNLDAVSKGIFEWNTTNCTPGSVRTHCDGSSIFLTLVWYTKVALSETAVEIGTIHMNALGSGVTGYTQYFHGYANNLQTFFMTTSNVGMSTSSVRDVSVNVADIINKTGATSMTASTSGYCWASVCIGYAPGQNLRLSDDICCEWHWLRTA